MSALSPSARLADVRQAFDGVAEEYDGPLGNNLAIQRMRAVMWERLTDTFPPGARLLDLGCGTGIDVVYLATHGYSVVGVDWSGRMVERTRQRIQDHGLETRAKAFTLGAHELNRLHGQRFDGIYSNLGPLNCVGSLEDTARACASLLNPGGSMVLSVIGRTCPWEIVYYGARLDWKRAFLRYARSFVPVPLRGETVWTRYYIPQEFYGAFAGHFELTSYRGLCILAPPPYLAGVWERFPRLCAWAAEVDHQLGSFPAIRNLGDHFLMVLAKRG